jgi:1-deoxy-D-xylulose-5-phosphate synthase
MVVMTPSDENETRQLLYTGYTHIGPAAIRYPRGTGPGATIEKTMTAVPIGKGRIVRDGVSVAILNFGALLHNAVIVADQVNATIADMRFVKPIDEDLIRSLASSHNLLVTLEENTISGGAGSAVTEFLSNEGIVMPVMQLGLPDRHVDHGSHAEQLADIGLDPDSIHDAISQRLELLKIPAQASQ